MKIASLVSVEQNWPNGLNLHKCKKFKTQMVKKKKGLALNWYNYNRFRIVYFLIFFFCPLFSFFFLGFGLAALHTVPFVCGYRVILGYKGAVRNKSRPGGSIPVAHIMMNDAIEDSGDCRYR